MRKSKYVYKPNQEGGTFNFTLRMNRKKDFDIIAAMESEENKAEFIKNAVRFYLHAQEEKHRKMDARYA